MKNSSHYQRLHSLDSYLKATQSLWYPHPFKQKRPAWCDANPELTQYLLTLSASELAYFSENHSALVDMLASFLPDLAQIPQLTALSQAQTVTDVKIDKHLGAGIPGRKWEQIKTFYHKVKDHHLAVVDWCGGKGYLGRVLATQWGEAVITLERNQSLIASGEVLADKYHLAQQFIKTDVLKDEVNQYIKGRQTVALHACGDLHRQLVAAIIETSAPSFALVPCCYHLGRNEHYHPFNQDLKLTLNTADLRMAVNETVTAHRHEIEKRDKDMAWKLGFNQLRTDITGKREYQSILPVNRAWLGGDFSQFCQQLAQREGLKLPQHCDWESYQHKGQQRQHAVMRLQLLRHCFKRVLELWLVMDMATFFETNGYQIEVSEFCHSDMTPRNILITGLTTRA